MKRQMVEAEAWAELAEHMTHSRAIPTYDPTDLGYSARGLCDAIYEMYCADLIDELVTDRMQYRIRNEQRRRKELAPPLFLWPEGKVEGRIAFARRMYDKLTKGEN